MPADRARELVDATMLFLDRHEEALHGGVPARALDACDSLHSGLCGTLAQQVGALHNELGGASVVEPTAPRAFADRLSRLEAGDAREREAWALGSLRKRMAEAEGVLLHLRLTLSKGSADGPALAAYARRVHAEAHAAQRTLDALRSALLDWADAVAALREHARAAPARDAADPRAMIRAARECLAAGVPRAAAPLLRSALASVTTAPSPLDRGSVDAVMRALDRPLDDAVLAWRLLDFVEYAANVSGLPAAAISARE